MWCVSVGVILYIIYYIILYCSIIILYTILILFFLFFLYTLSYPPLFPILLFLPFLFLFPTQSSVHSILVDTYIRLLIFQSSSSPILPSHLLFLLIHPNPFRFILYLSILIYYYLYHSSSQSSKYITPHVLSD